MHSSIKQETLNDRTERRYRVAASGAFVVVMLIIGLPLWWNTTKVYRATLPISSQIDEQIRLPVLIRIASTTNDETTMKAISTAADMLLVLLQDVSIYDRIQFDFSYEINNVPIPTGSSSSHDDVAILTAYFPAISRIALDFLIVSDQEWTYSGQLYFTSTSVTMVRRADDAMKTAKLIEMAILDVLIDVDQLNTIVRRDQKQRMSPDELGTLPERIQKRRVWDSTTLAAAYNIFVVFVYPNVSDNDNCHMNRLLDYMQPFVDRLANVTRLIVSRQNLYYVSLAAWQHRDASLDADIIDYDRLPLIVDSFDRYLSTIEADAPIRRIVVYIPPRPLYIVDEIGDRVASNALTVASWGGVTIVNECDDDDIDARLASIVLAQLRTLLGLDNSHPPPQSSFVNHPLTDWQIQRLAIRSFIDNTLQTASTLRSLDKLLDEISNIVINDRIADHVRTSSEHFDAAIAIGTDREHIDFSLACQYATQASIDADRAFYDESLLALLYFPEDQKYAIYIPLFLPVGYPVIMSVYILYKYFR